MGSVLAWLLLSEQLILEQSCSFLGDTSIWSMEHPLLEM